MYKLYRVVLAAEQRQQLKDLLATGRLANQANTHARILLKADATPGAPAWTDAQISEAFDVSVRSVIRVREAFVVGGLDCAVHRKKPAPRLPRKIDGHVEAHVVALACSAPPTGAARWTIRLLSDRVVELVELESISRESVRRILKKTNLSLG
jgi:hypothetical protein